MTSLPFAWAGALWWGAEGVLIGQAAGGILFGLGAVWLAGRLYDASGSYDVVWWLAIALGVIAGALNLPIREHRAPVPRTVAP